MGLPASSLIEGKYEILAKIREGGMGAIYKVRHRLLDEIRVIKVMRPQLEAREEWQRRFTLEAKMATQLRHANIAALYDFTIDPGGAAFIVMEYIDGVTLSDIRDGRGLLSLDLVVEIAAQIARAIAYLHRKRIVHRDISPDNLMVTEDSDCRPLVKLIDLGIAKVLQSGAGLTETGTFLGKIHYASPEQLGALEKGETIDFRSDLYSFGMVLHELLTGRLPFSTSGTPQVILSERLFKPPLDFSITDPANRVPESLRSVVRRALKTKREERFQTTDELMKALAGIQAGYSVKAAESELQEILLQRQHRLAAGPVLPAPSTTQETFDFHFDASATPVPPAAGPVAVSPIRGNAPAIPEALAGAAWPAPKKEEVREPDVSRRKLRVWPLLAAALLAAMAAALFLTIGSRDHSKPDRPSAASIAASSTPRAPVPAVESPTIVHKAAEEKVAEKALSDETMTGEPQAAAPVGELFITSSCEAVITEIRSLKDNEHVPVPSDAQTPVLLKLPRGRYSIRFESPTCGGSESVDAILASARTEIRLSRFRPNISVDELLKPAAR